MVINNWKLYYYRVFQELLDVLENDLLHIKAEDPTNFDSHPKTKLVKSILLCILRDIPADPTTKRFFLGNTLGSKYTHWRRAKKLLPDRYRLFFRFSSSEKAIIYVWFNDDTCLRKAGATTDVYNVFKAFLENGKIPDSMEELLKFSQLGGPSRNIPTF